MPARPGQGAAFSLAVVFVLVATTWPVGLRWWIDANAGPAMAAMDTPSMLSPGWKLHAQPKHSFKPNFENPSAEVNAWYANGQQEVGMYLGFYRHQDYSRKLVSSNNVLVTSGDRSWTSVASGNRVATAGSNQVSVRSAQLRSANAAGADHVGRLVAWQIYWINGTLTSSDYAAKVYSAVFRLLGRGDDSAVIVVYAEKPSSGAADLPLEAFIAANYSAIDSLLQQAKASR